MHSKRRVSSGKSVPFDGQDNMPKPQTIGCLCGRPCTSWKLAATRRTSIKSASIIASSRSLLSSAHLSFLSKLGSSPTCTAWTSSSFEGQLYYVSKAANYCSLPYLTDSNVLIRALPPEILDLVLAHCDKATCFSMMHVCRDFYDTAVRHIHREITIISEKALDSFIEAAHMARSDRKVCGSVSPSNILNLNNFSAQKAVRFHNTRALHFKVVDDWFTSAAQDPRVWVLSVNWMWRRLPLHLKLNRVPSMTEDGRIIFPNLTSFSYMKCCIPPPTRAFSFAAHTGLNLSRLQDERLLTILSQVDTVHLLCLHPYHAASAWTDDNQCVVDFRSLGMNKIQHIHEDLCPAPDTELQPTDILARLGPSKHLKSITYHFSVPPNMFSSWTPHGLEQSSLLDDFWQRTRLTQRPIHWYAEDLAVILVRMAKHNRPPSKAAQYPELQRVTLDLGGEDLNNRDIGKRSLYVGCSNHLIALLKDVQEGLVGRTYTESDLAVHIPEYVIRLGSAGPAWRLAEHAFKPPSVLNVDTVRWQRML